MIFPFSIGDDGVKKVIEKIQSPKTSYIHSFAMTENYIILEVWPLYINAFFFNMEQIYF